MIAALLAGITVLFAVAFVVAAARYPAERRHGVNITIPIQPATKKNSQQICRNGRGRPLIRQSDQYTAYEKAALLYLRRHKWTGSLPVNVRAVFYVPDRRRRDLVNLLEALDDCLVRAGVLPDDCWAIIRSHDGSHVEVDKLNPRTEIEISEVKA